MNSFLNGAIMMACLAIGLFFLKFWRSTSDRFFAIFAIAFWLLAVDRVVVAVVGQSSTSQPSEYLVRLVAFLVIIAAVVEKNRKS